MKSAGTTTIVKLLIRCTTLLALVACQTSNANVITHGNLTTDDTTDYITDTGTDRQYTRFDAFDMTVAETYTAIAAGGSYDGWSIATWDIADDFIAASLAMPTTPCSGNVANGTDCGTVNGWTVGDFGSTGYNDVDYFAYLSSHPTVTIGLVGYIPDSGTAQVKDYETWSNHVTLDTFEGNSVINLLLYKDASASASASAVPAPMTLVLMSTGLFGVGVATKCRKKLS